MVKGFIRTVISDIYFRVNQRN